MYKKLKSKKVLLTIIGLLIICVLFGYIAQTTTSEKAESITNEQDIYPQGINGESLENEIPDSLKEAVVKTRYSVEKVDEKLIATNQANDLRAEFDETGLKLKPSSKDAKWKSNWRLKSLGFRDEQIEVKKGELTSEKQRVEIKREDQKLVEWFENKPEGLEHGFTLAERPTTEQDKTKPLRLVIEVSGDLTAKSDKNGQALILNDETGKKTLRYEKLKVWDADNKEQTAWMKVSDNKVYLEVEEADAKYPLTIDPTFVEQQKLLASDGASIDLFGHSVAISGDIAVVGAYGDDDNGTDSGSAYVYERSGTTWSEQQKLTASDGASIDSFGFSVAISGNTIIVGARLDDDNGSNSGSAYVFERSGTTWSEQQKLHGSDTTSGDAFGQSVAISGETVIVGAYTDDDNGSNSGSAYVFERSGTTWSEQQKLTASDAASVDLFGHSVGISGDTVIVGAYRNDDSGADTGSAYVYVRSGASWTEQQKLLASDAAGGDRFGYSVAISGNTSIIGAYHDDDNGTDSGSAYVYERSGTTWSEQQKLTASDGASIDRFGFSVAISGNTSIVGATLDGGGFGSAYVYERSGTTWSEQKLTASDAAASDQFGRAVAISGATSIVGAYKDADNGTDSGSAYIYSASISGPTYTYVVTKTADTNDGSCDPSDCSLREAVAAANATSDDDVIGFASPLFDSPQTITLTMGSLNITNNGTLTIDGPGADNLIVSGNNATQVLFLTNSSVNAEVNKITISNGNSGQGGGIYNSGTLTLNEVTLSNNYASTFGGGILNESGSTATLNNSFVTANSSNNLASGGGGGIANRGTMTLNSSTVNDNTSIATAGGIFSSGTMTINDSTISGNASTSGGGGGLFALAEVTINNSTLSGNTAQFSGGGIYVYNVGGEVNLNNSTITNNSGGSDSGGVFNLRIFNTANSIIAGNNASISPDVGGTNPYNSLGYNLIGKTDGSSGFGATGDQTGTIASPLDPVLGPLQNNGGTTLTHLLLGGSPAINGGSNALIPTGFTNDQRGDGFPRIVNSTVDIGSVEVTTTDQTITFGALADKTFGDAPFDVSATASSGLTVSFSASGDCSISGVTVTITGVGSCTITASQAGDGTYNAAPDVDQSFNINKANQTITFGSLADKTYGDSSFDVSATSDSGLSVSFAAVGFCSISGVTVTLDGAGDCTITASQAGDSNYESASDVAHTFTINKATLTVTANNKFIDFGDPDPSFTFTYSGFVSGDTASDIDTAPTCTVSGIHTEPGNYPIECSGGVDNSYDFTYVNANLNINLPSINEDQKLIPTFGTFAFNQNAGASVAISGNTAVVGAPNIRTGRVWVYVKTASGWEQQQELLASDGDPRGDQFGSGVAIEGDTIVVGARNKYFPVGTTSRRGAIYVFERINGVWQETFKKIGNGSSFGRQVAISNGTIIAGTLVANAAFVYVKENGTWIQQAELKSPFPTGNAYFGVDVDISGDTAIVGDYLATVNGVAERGAAHIFVRNGTTWTLQQSLTESDDAVRPSYGSAVAIDGDTVAVGMFNGNDNGEVYVYERSGTTWSPQQTLAADDGFTGERFGVSVDIDGNGLIVGADYDDYNPGSAYVFKKDGGSWELLNKLRASDAGGRGEFGLSTAIEGNKVLVGSPGSLGSNNLFRAGAGYIFTVDISEPSTLTVDSASGTFGGTTTLSATLTKTSDSSVVSGKMVEFTLDGNSVGSAITDANGVATLSGVSLSGISVGSYPTAVSASFTGDDDLDPSAGENSLTVSKANQTITFDALSDKTYGDGTFDVSATSSVGLPVSFGAVGFCSISGVTVTLTGAGDCTITASQAGDSNYNAATDVPHTFTINKATLTISPDDQTITFGDSDPTFTFGYSGFVNSEDSSVVDTSPTCGVTGAHSDAGDYTIECSGGADNNYSFSYGTATLTIEKADQTITFGALADKTYGDGTFDVSANASSGLPVSFVASGTCSVLGTTVTITGAGSCTITASQSGDGNYNAATDVDQTFNISKVALSVTPDSQTITFGDADPTFTFSYSGFVNGESSSVISTEPTCSVAGVHTDAGDYPITCSGGIDDNYNFNYGAATLTIEKADQTITFGTLADKTFGDAPFDVSATASSSLVVSFAVSGDCTIAGVTVTITGAGSCTVIASQSGDGNYNAASDVDQSFTINKADQTINFAALADKTFGDAPFNVSATSTSGLAVSFVASGDCSIVGSTVTITGAGSCTITASQGGDDDYNAASDVDQSFTINQADQTITFGALADKTYGDGSFSVSATASSGLSVSFSASGNCSVVGTTVTITGAGSCTITASQAGDGNYNAAPDANQSFTINKAVLDVNPDNQQIIVGSPDPTFTFSYSGFVNGENSGVIDTAPTCEVSGPHSGVGSYTITCSGGADNNYSFNYGTATLSVIYNFNGFFSPIDNIGLNNVKSGRAIPVKFSLNGNFGLNILTAGYPVSYQIPCNGNGDDGPEIPTETAGNSSLSYSSGNDQYKYVWKTEKSWKQTCRRLVVGLNDGSFHTADFKFK